MNAEVQEKLDDLTLKSLIVLGDKLDSEDEKIQISAAKDILDRSIPIKKEIKTNGGPVINLDFSKVVEGLRKVKEIRGEVESV